MEKVNLNSSGKDETELSSSMIEANRKVLCEAMGRRRPEIEDFQGVRGYLPKNLYADSEELRKKENEIKLGNRESDEHAEALESLVAYTIGTEYMFPTRKDHFAFPASRYDDKCRGVDVVFGVSKANSDEMMTFGADVASGTNKQNIDDKISRVFDRYKGKSNIIYCAHNGRRWKEFDAPMFVLGMSPASEDAAVSRLNIEDGMLAFGANEDPETAFILLSEMREQLYLHKKIIGDHPEEGSKEAKRLDKVNGLLAAVQSNLYRVLGINKGTKEEKARLFDQLYPAKKAEVERYDKVYGNIISETEHRRNIRRGNLIGKAYSTKR